MASEDAGLDTERFDASKPQFREPRKQSTKVVLDERFASVLTDPKFQINVRDKYGRKKTKAKAENELSAFYQVEQDSQNEDHPDPRKNTDHESSSSDEEESKTQDPSSRIAYLTALSRGEIEVSSSSDESDQDDEDNDNHSQSSKEDASEASDDIMGKAGILDPSQKEQVEITMEESPFLAVMNMDWSNVRAVDIFAIVSSFVVPGSVKSVQVYASDFGIQRMEKEERFGPSGLWKTKKQDAHDEAEKHDRNEPSDQNLDCDLLDSDFDAEKLREYEALRMKYFFAIVEMTSPSHADTVYKEVDGMEFEHSSAALDVRTIPMEEHTNVIRDRPLRDEASSIPSNYEPPDFIVTALQQTNVQCTWEAGDRDRERALTKYVSGQDWRDIAESDDIKAYLASDVSSDEEDGDGKTSQMRRMLGLDSDAESAEKDETVEQLTSNDDDDDRDEFLTFHQTDKGKQVSYVPGEIKLADKIRSTIAKKKTGSTEPTPWEQYLEKKKQKKKERKAAARAKREEINVSRRQRRDSKDESPKKKRSDQMEAELELLVANAAGDDEVTRDFDMRGLQRVEQNKSKKLKGARKRKEEAIAANLVGAGFQINMQDDRFKAVLDGTDDRFGIDRTDPQYKETPAMREIMAEQTRRRKKRKTKVSATSVPADVIADAVNTTSSGAFALSSLVSRLKQKVAK